MPESKLIQGISFAAPLGRLTHPRPALGLAVVPAFVMACSGGGEAPAARNGDDPGRLTDIQASSVLKRGDVGPGVAAATAFFTKYGYFENDDLRLTYPAWRPVVGPAPANDAVFGDELQRAVEAFQARSNLAVTGEIDAATRAAMDARFCGVPDTFRSDDGEKWAHSTDVDWQTKTHIVWSMVNNPAPPTPTTITRELALAAIESAFAAWDIKTNLTFEPDDGNPNPDISVSWVPRSDNILGIGTPTAIFITNSAGWGTAAQNLSTVVGHEIGHAIGLAHSTIKGPGGAVPMMFGSVDTSGGTSLPVVPTADEIFAVDASPYTTFQPAFGGEASATDIGSSIAGGTEYTWKIGTITADSNGFRIYRWRSGSADWQQINGGGVRIDVAGMVPWVVSATGVMWEKTGVTASNPNGTGWGSRGNCGFVDVGANKNSVVWALGGSVDANGDYAVYRYDGATGSGSCPTSTAGSRWLLTDGRARYIDVAVDGSPWVVTNSGKIYHRNGVSGSNLGGTSWTRFSGLASDIAVGPDEWGAHGSVYVTGSSGDNLNYLLNEQVPNTWYQTWSSSKGTSLSVGKDSLPWLVALDNNSWHRTP